MARAAVVQAKPAKLSAHVVRRIGLWNGPKAGKWSQPRDAATVSDKKTSGDAARRGRSPEERKASQHTRSPEREHQSSERRDWKEVCKERPDSRKARKGSGGSKDFVPWCDRK